VDLDSVVIDAYLRDNQEFAKVAMGRFRPETLTAFGQIAWQTIQEYEKQHRRLPPRELITDETGFVFTQMEGEPIPTDVILEKLQKRHRFSILRDGLKEASLLLSRGEMDKAEAQALGIARELDIDSQTMVRYAELPQAVDQARILYENTKNGITGVPFPWPAMTAMTFGLWPGTLTFFVARPGTGKTWVAVLVCWSAWAQYNKKVLIVSPEMGLGELGERIVARHGQHSYKNLVSGRIGKFAEPRLYSTYEKLKEGKNFYIIDDEDHLTSDYIDDAVHRLKPDLVAIDSVYMLRVEQKRLSRGAGSRGDRFERMASTAAWMRSGARRTGVPWLGIHQLSRAGDIANNKKIMRQLKRGKFAGQLQNAVAYADELLWHCHNLFALVQDEDMKVDKKMLIVPLKVRRQANFTLVAIRWCMEKMEFEELGNRVIEKDDELAEPEIGDIIL
jgi:hypothetical protein